MTYRYKIHGMFFFLVVPWAVSVPPALSVVTAVTWSVPPSCGAARYCTVWVEPAWTCSAPLLWFKEVKQRWFVRSWRCASTTESTRTGWRPAGVCSSWRTACWPTRTSRWEASTLICSIKTLCWGVHVWALHANPEETRCELHQTFFVYFCEAPEDLSVLVQLSSACRPCSEWQKVILMHHRNPDGSINWANCSPPLWRTDHWELAKVPLGKKYLRVLQAYLVYSQSEAVYFKFTYILSICFKLNLVWRSIQLEWFLCYTFMVCTYTWYTYS